MLCYLAREEKLTKVLFLKLIARLGRIIKHSRNSGTQCSRTISIYLDTSTMLSISAFKVKEMFKEKQNFFFIELKLMVNEGLIPVSIILE